MPNDGRLEPWVERKLQKWGFSDNESARKMLWETTHTGRMLIRVWMLTAAAAGMIVASYLALGGLL